MESRLVDGATARQFLSHRSLDDGQNPPSQIRSRAGSAKGRFRVSFSEGHTLNFSQGKRDVGQTPSGFTLSSRDASPTRRLHWNEASNMGPREFLGDPRPGCQEQAGLSFSAHEREPGRRPQKDRKPVEELCGYPSRSANDVLSAAQASCGDFGSLEAPSGRVDPLVLCSGEGLLEQAQSGVGPRKGRDLPACRCPSPSRLELKRSLCQNTLGTSRCCFQEPAVEGSGPHVQDLVCGLHPGTESPVGAEKSSLVISVLQQLLELVDHFWAGPGSLLLNKNFLAPARDLLASLVAVAPSLQEGSSRAAPGLGTTSVQAQQAQRTSGGDRRVTKPEEDLAASLKGLGRTAGASVCPCDLQGIYSFSYDELLRRNEKLSDQVDTLTFELKQLRKQQETIGLLRESQRSLVSTNNFLLQQLHKEHGPGGVGGEGRPERASAPAMDAAFAERTPASRP